LDKKTVTLVSGNQNKVRELSPFFPQWTLKRRNLDLEEPQSLDLHVICRSKALSAFKELGSPILVEDTEFCLDALAGLPGPFIKFFEMKLGDGALIHLLKGHRNRKGRARSCLMYYDGIQFVQGTGVLEGAVSEKVLPGEGFGFDCCFIPEGESLTLSLLGLETKKKISHRRRAIEEFLRNLSSHNL
jgi:non-canonical purine NTP pyrophosphatase (RdgB/HAM1 family)